MLVKWLKSGFTTACRGGVCLRPVRSGLPIRSRIAVHPARTTNALRNHPVSHVGAELICRLRLFCYMAACSMLKVRGLVLGRVAAR